MANFRAYPGLYVKAIVSECGLEKDNIYQILNIRYNITLLGVNGVFSQKRFAQLVEPVTTPYYGVSAKFITKNNTNE